MGCTITLFTFRVFVSWRIPERRASTYCSFCIYSSCRLEYLMTSRARTYGIKRSLSRKEDRNSWRSPVPHKQMYESYSTVPFPIVELGFLILLRPFMNSRTTGVHTLYPCSRSSCHPSVALLYEEVVSFFNPPSISFRVPCCCHIGRILAWGCLSQRLVTWSRPL